MSATINYTLQQIAEVLFIKYKSKERAYIDERIDKFQSSIKKHFGTNVNDVVLFGSYQRDTILPREFDNESDIDVLILFNQEESEFQPETYRNHLKRFAQKTYFNKKVIKIIKDHPSVVLEMSSIKFDLVPCVIKKHWWHGARHHIPSKNNDWMVTTPHNFTTYLTKQNTRYNSIVKPIIRLLKRWNASVNYPYSSYILEQIIADMNFQGDNYQTGFLYAIKKLPTNNLSGTQSQKVYDLQTKAIEIKKYLNQNNQSKAIEIVYDILKIK